jgi:membrane associated rhomboid family serine protease
MDLLAAAVVWLNGAILAGRSLWRGHWAMVWQPLLWMVLAGWHPLAALCGLLGLVSLQHSLIQRYRRALRDGDQGRIKQLRPLIAGLLWGQCGRQALQPPALGDQLQAFCDQFRAREWNKSVEIYQQLCPNQAAWVHLLACRSYARLARFDQCVLCLERARALDRPAPASFPIHYAVLTFGVSGSAAHLEAWLAGLKDWPEHARLHARALCQARAGQLEQARQLWQQARRSAPADFLPFIEADEAQLEQLPATIEAEQLNRMQAHFASLEEASALAHASLGVQAKAWLIVILLGYALQPVDLAQSLYLSRDRLPWGLLTSLLVHSNLTHLVLNLLALAYLSPWVETAYGGRFLLFFLLSAVSGGLAQVLWTPRSQLVGASAGVMGILGARLALLLKDRQLPRPYWRLQFAAMLLTVLLQVIADKVIPHLGGVAHMGGLACGFALAWLSRPKPLGPQIPKQ